MHVVAGVLKNERGRVLLAERPAGRHLAGSWEFPGGKLEGGETRLAALERELDEEIGISVDAARPLICVRYRYPDREILLDVWVVTRYRGAPVGLDGQRLRWCDLAALAAEAILPADRPAVTALRLPERLTALETPIYRIGAPIAGPRDRRPLYGVLCDGLEDARAALGAGADFVALRPVLSADALSALCASINLPVFARGIALAAAWSGGAAGINEIVP